MTLRRSHRRRRPEQTRFERSPRAEPRRSPIALQCSAGALVPEQARFVRGTLTCPVTRQRYCGLMEAITTVSDSVAAFAGLSDEDLVERVKHLVACERRASVALIRSLVEFDARRLYLRAASVGRIGVQPYRNRTGGAALSDSARGSRTRRPHADCRSAARAAFDRCKS